MAQAALPASPVPVAAGRILFVDEVLSQGVSLRGCAVRVTGHLQSYNAKTALASVTHRGCSLHVDTSLVPPNTPYKLRTLMQFIGEVDIKRVAPEGGEAVVLVARVARCVDGLDLELFVQAVERVRKSRASC